jgi:(1->4)-alpha-D-glucan 1-alpha-D-glucosylmutase
VSEDAAPRIPTSTYRLQFHAGFTFDDARQILDYLRALGISDIYASPYFQASPESTHGYDVADHNRLNPLVGDEHAFRAYCSALRERGMGQVLDFVPNHMGIGESLNLWWMDVLEDGKISPYAQFFDIDWRPTKVVLSDRILLPILGDRYGEVLEGGAFKLTFESGALFLSCFGTKLPIAPTSYPTIFERAVGELSGPARDALHALGSEFARLPTDETRVEAKASAKERLRQLAEDQSAVGKAIEHAMRSIEGEPGNRSSFDALHDLLEAQAYRLSYWRSAAEEINYRRFFDINNLAAIRVEIPEVFEAAHKLVFEWLTRGEVTGLRIDHVDGLWDPRGYLRRLQERYAELRGLSAEGPGLYLVVEKILDFDRESLPSDWPVHGTTGYDFTNQMVQIFTDPRAQKRMTRIFERFTGFRESFADLAYQKKMLVMQLSLSSEITALGKALDELSEMYRGYRDLTTNTLVTAIREVMACFPVYRTYTTEEAIVSADDERVILRAIGAARRRNPSIEKPVLDFLRGVLLLRLPDGFTPAQREAHVRFVMKFQQCSGPIMAKGVEDTTFYIYNRLISLNEVGGKPEQFGIDPAEFHRLNACRAERWPHAMLGTSTHDTKRSEDVRLRITALSEIPELWDKAIRRWSKRHKKYRTKIDDEHAPSRNEEYLLYQTLVGTWPLEPLQADQRDAYNERIEKFMIKAIKEAKINSSWIEPNQEWEEASVSFVKSILSGKGCEKFCADLTDLAEIVASLGAINSLAQIIVKCTAPGLPDFYQGTEIWDLSLVDPDNRRPVDYSLRQRLLESLEHAHPEHWLKEWRTGQIKLLLIQRLLTFRAENRLLFLKGDYKPLEAVGEKAKHVIAFERELGGQSVVVVVPRLTRSLGLWPVGDAWSETFVAAVRDGAEPWHDVLSRKTVLPGDRLALPTILADVPFAVLHRRREP